MTRLRRVDCSGAGITRRRRGRGFEYVDEQGQRLRDPEVLERIRQLAIPPAWEEVWICPHPMGHIQATGVDSRGRKQYRYHDRWRERRDREKFESMVGFARALPRLRRRVERDLRRRKISRERVLACGVRLLDRGFFRIGSEDYAEENKTYGVATMQKRHVTVDGDTVTFDYRGKGNARRVQAVGDPAVARLARRLLRRRSGGHQLLAYRDGGQWTGIRSEEINEYVKSATGGDYTAKDFRTWNATVLAAAVLAARVREKAPGPASARASAKRAAVKDVARFMGISASVCRASYIDPRVFDRFDGGLTIAGVFDRLPDEPEQWPDVQGPLEKAVLDLLEGRDSAAVEGA